MSTACDRLAELLGVEPEQACPRGRFPSLGVRRIARCEDPEADLGRAAEVERGQCVAYHVTDHPDTVRRALARCVPLDRPRDEGFDELGPGLYVSAVPEIWMHRSRDKWRFLQGLTPAQRRRLADAILSSWQLRQPGYLTPHEREQARQDLERWVQDGRSPIVHLASQPYNVEFWRPEFLRPLGIAPGPQPEAVPVRFRGEYAELDRVPSRRALETLKEAGLDGAYFRDAAVSWPQLVIWRNEAVEQFGDYTPPACPKTDRPGKR